MTGRSDPTTPPTRRRLWPAGVCVVALLVLLLVFPRNPDLTGRRPENQLVRWAVAAGMLAAYLSGYRALRAADPAAYRPTVIAFAAAFCAVGLFVRPFHSTDVYCNVNIGWVQAGHGLNPYVHPVADIPDWRADPMLSPHWTDTRSAYGFLFARAADGLCRLGGGDLWATVLLFKAAGVVAFGLTGWVVWWGCRRFGVADPDRPLYLFLWNPLLLVHAVVEGHNDLWLGLPLALGVLLAAGGGWRLVLAAVAASVLVKYASAVLLPLFLLFLVRTVGWRKTAASLLVAAVFVGGLGWHYVKDDWDRIPLAGQVKNQTAMCHSVPMMAYFPFEVGSKLVPPLKPHLGTVQGAIKLACWAGFAAFYAWLALRRFRGPGYPPGAFLRDCVLVLFVLVCFASSKFYPWYLGMFLPLALWLPESDRLRRAVLAVAAGQVLSITFIEQTHFLNALVMTVLPTLWASTCGCVCRAGRPGRGRSPRTPAKSKYLPPTAKVMRQNRAPRLNSHDVDGNFPHVG